MSNHSDHVRPVLEAPTLTIARVSRLLESNATTDLTLPQYRVLGLLSLGDERATLLAARLAVAKPTLTSLVDSLVEREYVVRESTDGDRRAVRLSITAAGRAALAEAEDHLGRLFDEVLALSDDRDGILVALQQLGQALDRRWAAVRAAASEGTAERAR